MSAVRIIPRLDVKGPNLVKGIHLEGLRVLGDPQEFAQYYHEHGADELFYMDVVASLYERNSLKDIIRKTAENIFIPITVGGGIRSVADIGMVLKAGADKVCINTAALKNPQLVKEASLQFGSSTIVVALEVIRQPSGEYLLFTDNGREYTGQEAVAWAKKAEELGAGELVLTSVDQEGTGEGFDLDLIKSVASQVGIPVVAHGGAKNPEDIKQAVLCGASAVCASSILHYDYVFNGSAKKNIDKSEGNTRFLETGKVFGKIKTTTLEEIKGYLNESGIECRA